MAKKIFDINEGKLHLMEAALKKIAGDVTGSAGQALREEAEIEMTEAKRRVPVDTGALRASGRVEGPFVSSDEVAVVLSFGDAASGYALYVHEDLDAFHRTGQAKYLESVIVESAPYIGDRVARRIKGLTGG